MRVLCVLAGLVLGLGGADAVAGDALPHAEAVSVEERFFRLNDIFRPCDGDCAVHVSAGPALDTGLASVFGISGYAAPWTYKFDRAGIVTLSFSRPLIELGEYFSISPEVGVAQRFGVTNSAEFWAVAVVAYHWFPWDHWVDTKVSFTTGINVALQRDRYEDDRDLDSDLENLLHLLRPEIAFRLPQHPHVELTLGIHHRSGGRDIILGPVIGSNEASGAQFLTAGIRWHF